MSQQTQLGLVLYALNLHQRRHWKNLVPDAPLPLALLEECRLFGAGGFQCPIDAHRLDTAEVLRRQTIEEGLHLEAIIAPPGDSTDLTRFEEDIKAAKAAGASLARTVIIPGRRYEQFTSLEAFRDFETRGVQALERAEPVLARHRFRLAVENHKDQRIPERLDTLRRISSEWVGMCVDVGNSFALLEDPLEVVRAYAPWAMTVHLKDQALQECSDGFLFGDVALGDGFLDLPAMVKILRDAHPDLRFNLEVITRDPLHVPILQQAYYAPMGDIPAAELGRALRMLRSVGSVEPLQSISMLSPAEQVEAETRNIRRSLDYAGRVLRI